MRRYTAVDMIKRSLNYVHFQVLEEGERKEVLDRMTALICEERAFCDKGNHQHLCDIFSTIAIYETLRRRGMTEVEARNAVAKALYHAIEPMRRRMEHLARFGWFWHGIKAILPTAFRHGSGTGWRFTWFDKQPKNEYRFEVNACIYQKIFAKRNLSSLGPMICKCDVIMYGTLPRIDFQRKGTLCCGDEICDFKFVRHPKGEPFERTDSR